MMSYWGYHLMLDCSGCDISKISSRQSIYDFAKDIVPKIGMQAHGEPIIEYMLEGDPKQGWSLVQLITTSNITAHFLELDGTAYFDIFSCKEFDMNLAQDIVTIHFKPKKTRVNFITRQAD